MKNCLNACQMWPQQWPSLLSVLGCSRRAVRKMKLASKRRDSQLRSKKTREVWVGSKLPLNNPSLLLCPLTFTISLCFTNWRPRTSWYFLSCCGSVVVRLSAEFEGLRFGVPFGTHPTLATRQKTIFLWNSNTSIASAFNPLSLPTWLQLLAQPSNLTSDAII